MTKETMEAPAVGTWEIDPSHSGIEVVARHLMVSKVRGRFGVFGGTVHVDEVPEKSWVEATIDAASIDTGNADRDKHLRSGDFLDVEQYPEITFRSTATEITGENTLTVTGDLTVRGTTRPVTMEVEYLGLIGDPWGKTRAGFMARGEIDREDFGMTWNVALEKGGVLVGKKLQFELDVQAVGQEAKAETAAA
jgi:polyisoprenoid-binding protein YceI